VRLSVTLSDDNIITITDNNLYETRDFKQNIVQNLCMEHTHNNNLFIGIFLEIGDWSVLFARLLLIKHTPVLYFSIKYIISYIFNSF
jgi:hypothetical protein